MWDNVSERGQQGPAQAGTEVHIRGLEYKLKVYWGVSFKQMSCLEHLVAEMPLQKTRQQEQQIWKETVSSLWEGQCEVSGDLHVELPRRH